MQVLSIPLSLFICLLVFVEELSDDYQTDYDEEAVESALSDYEAFNHGSEHTEGEETVDTFETVGQKPASVAQCSHFFFISSIGEDEWKGNGDIMSLSFTGWRCSNPSATQTENSPLRFSALRFSANLSAFGDLCSPFQC